MADDQFTIADLPRVSVPAPGAQPTGDGLHLRTENGAVEAWRDAEGKSYVRVMTRPEHAVLVEDGTAWEQIADSLGMSDTEGKAAPAGRVETPTDHEEQTGIMVAFTVPEGDARDMVLDLDTGLPWTELHLTLAYLGTTDGIDDEGEFYSKALDALREVAGNFDQIEGQVSGVGRFSVKGDADAFVYLFDSPGLPEFRQAIVDALEEAGVDVNHEHGFQPHITLAYLKEGEDNPIRRAEAKVLAFDAVTFCFGDQKLNIRLGGTNPDEQAADAYLYEAGANGSMIDSTAPAAMPTGYKALPPQFRRGKNGKNKVGKRSGPPIAAGSFVAWGNQRGKVDLIVTNGKVPGVEADITGTPDKPAARVVVYSPAAGGKLKSTGKKVGVPASTLKRAAPFAFGTKDLDLDDPEGALVDVLAGYYEVRDDSTPIVDPLSVKTVYERGLESWPGDDWDATREAWALGRTKAFLVVAAGGEVKGYAHDRDLLPEGHALAECATREDGGTPLPEEKVRPAENVEGETLDRSALDEMLAGLRSALR